jgi:uncharacterized protein YhaN
VSAREQTLDQDLKDLRGRLTGAAEDRTQTRTEFDAIDGKLVRVDGMSTGTADQLYLALRMASVGDYLDRADALPFVADDLFINFDDARAKAGFEVLGELANKTQVLFTRHRHLVEITERTLGKSVNVVSLLDAPVTSAA